MTALRLRAPGKVNWTLEVLGKRPDGYHEVRTVLQTAALSDSLVLTPADTISLTLGGDYGVLGEEAPESNLAYRAATALKERAGHSGGVRIELQKAIPIAAGLGGGSSDAAAVLGGLRALWQLSLSDDDLAAVGAELGSDVPFFLRGGTALATGRGERITPLPNGPSQRLVIAWPKEALEEDKTARMYAALRPEHHSDGTRTGRITARLRSGEPVRDEDVCNVFEAVLPEMAPAAAETFQRAAALGAGRPHLCGSGPAFFFLIEPDQAAARVVAGLQRLGLRACETRIVEAGEAPSSDG